MAIDITTPRRALDKIETSSRLDDIAAPIQGLIDRVLVRGVRDFLHGVWLGHPLHPVLVQAPVGAWLSAGLLDLLPGTDRAATALVGAGTATAAPAAVAGWADWASLAPEQRRVGLVHAGTNAVAIGLQAASFIARTTGRRRTGRRLSFAALALASAGAYLGGHLSFRQAAAVSHAAPQLRRIGDGWHRIGALADLTGEKPLVGDVDGVAVLAVRDGEAVTAILATCGHQGGPLGEGEITDVGGAACVVCPWHGSTFRLADGCVVVGPAANDQPKLRTRVRDGYVDVALP